VYTDRDLTCVDCGQSFTFTARDQEFYAQRSFSEPRRCQSCRAAKKAQRDSAGGGSSSYGGYSASGGYSSGGYSASGGYSSGGYGSGGYGGSRDRGPRQMFTATCSQCGQEAQLPFRPTNGKPVYCSDCFRTMRGA
jgi:CxxC-x17-CxxC domain-containing protein